MKMRKLLLPMLFALGLSACGDDTDYSGTYVYTDTKFNSNTTKVFQKTANGDYLIQTTLIAGKTPIAQTGVIKNKVLYNSNNNILGEFKNDDFVGTNGNLYKKQK